MSRKQTRSHVLREIKQNPNAKEEYIDFERPKIQGSLKVMTREEKMKEASKPLYLRRYE